MRVLVTGGAGFIGSHSVEGLLADGHQVRVLDNFSTGKLSNLPQNSERLEITEGDITNRADCEAAMVGISHVLHLAAQVSVATSFQAPAESATVNILGFLNIAEAAIREGVRTLVYASSAAVYGNLATLPLDETMVCKPISPYGFEKLSNENYARILSLDGASRISMVGLRYFNVYGPRQDPSSPYSGVISIFLQKLLEGKDLSIFGDGEQTRDFVFVRDVAKINLLALSKRQSVVMNVAANSAASLHELINHLSSYLSVKPKLHYAPARSGDIRYSRGCVNLLSAELAWTPSTNLADGLRDYVDSV